MSVEFTDNSVKFKEALQQKAEIFLEEVGNLVEGDAVRNSRVDTGLLRASWHHIREDFEVIIGSLIENAIWEEFGTGEYAINGDGRKGGWLYTNKNGDTVFTYGKYPNRTLTRAVNSNKSKIIARARQLFGELNND